MNKQIISALVNIVLLVFGVAATSVIASPYGDHAAAYAAYKKGDYPRAAELWRELADKGDAIAQYELGYMYVGGRGVTADLREAARWFRQAATQGNAEAQNDLGTMNFNGEGIPRNYTEAQKWFRLAAAQGHVFAQYYLGLIYCEGRGVPQNYVRAHMWFNLAAGGGDSYSESMRDTVAAKMTDEQIAKAQEMATNCAASSYKNCD